MSTVIQKVKILLDEHQEPFIPFTTSDSIFINGTDERLTDYLDASIKANKVYIGKLTDYNTAAKALNLDDLEEGKMYIILNDMLYVPNDTAHPEISGTDLYYKVTSDTWGVISGRYMCRGNKTTLPYLIIHKHKYTEEIDGVTRTNYAEISFMRLVFPPDYTIQSSVFTIYERQGTGSGAPYGVLDTWGTYKNMYAVLTNLDQTISSKKTFNTLPESAVVPTSNSQLVNKKYVDDNVLTKAYQLVGLNAYSTSATYNVDDYVYYNNLIYKCNTAITVAEAWNSTHWTQKTYIEYLQDTLTI